MKTTEFRFQVPGSHTSFGFQIDTRTNTPYVSGAHPYDETEYHWARRSAQALESNLLPAEYTWTVYRCGKKIATYILAGTDAEQAHAIAERLLNHDCQAHLKPTRAIW